MKKKKNIVKYSDRVKKVEDDLDEILKDFVLVPQSKSCRERSGEEIYRSLKLHLVKEKCSKMICNYVCNTNRSEHFLDVIKFLNSNEDSKILNHILNRVRDLSIRDRERARGYIFKINVDFDVVLNMPGFINGDNLKDNFPIYNMFYLAFTEHERHEFEKVRIELKPQGKFWDIISLFKSIFEEPNIYRNGIENIAEFSYYYTKFKTFAYGVKDLFENNISIASRIVTLWALLNHSDLNATSVELAIFSNAIEVLYELLKGDNYFTRVINRVRNMIVITPQGLDDLLSIPAKIAKALSEGTIIHKLINIFVVAISSKVFEYSHFQDFLDIALGCINKVKSGGTILSNIFDIFGIMSSSINGFLTTYDFNELFGYTGDCAVMRKVNRLNEMLKRSGDNPERIPELLEECEILKRELCAPRYTSLCTSEEIKEFLNNIKHVQMSMPNAKSPPVGVILYGGPGTWKTSFVDYFHTRHKIASNIPLSVNCLQNYSEGITHQTLSVVSQILLFNDIFSTKEECLEEPYIAKLQSAVDSTGFHMSTASLSEKERSTIFPDYVFVTTNESEYKLTQSLNSEKLHRRYVVIECKFNKNAEGIAEEKNVKMDKLFSSLTDSEMSDFLTGKLLLIDYFISELNTTTPHAITMYGGSPIISFKRPSEVVNWIMYMKKNQRKVSYNVYDEDVCSAGVPGIHNALFCKCGQDWFSDGVKFDIIVNSIKLCAHPELRDFDYDRLRKMEVFNKIYFCNQFLPLERWSALGMHESHEFLQSPIFRQFVKSSKFAFELDNNGLETKVLKPQGIIENLSLKFYNYFNKEDAFTEDQSEEEISDILREFTEDTMKFNLEVDDFNRIKFGWGDDNDGYFFGIDYKKINKIFPYVHEDHIFEIGYIFQNLVGKRRRENTILIRDRTKLQQFQCALYFYCVYYSFKPRTESFVSITDNSEALIDLDKLDLALKSQNGILVKCDSSLNTLRVKFLIRRMLYFTKFKYKEWSRDTDLVKVGSIFISSVAVFGIMVKLGLSIGSHLIGQAVVHGVPTNLPHVLNETPRISQGQVWLGTNNRVNDPVFKVSFYSKSVNRHTHGALITDNLLVVPLHLIFGDPCVDKDFKLGKLLPGDYLVVHKEGVEYKILLSHSNIIYSDKADSLIDHYVFVYVDFPLGNYSNLYDRLLKGLGDKPREGRVTIDGKECDIIPNNSYLNYDCIMQDGDCGKLIYLTNTNVVVGFHTHKNKVTRFFTEERNSYGCLLSKELVDIVIARFNDEKGIKIKIMNLNMIPQMLEVLQKNGPWFVGSHPKSDYTNMIKYGRSDETRMGHFPLFYSNRHDESKFSCKESPIYSVIKDMDGFVEFCRPYGGHAKQEIIGDNNTWKSTHVKAYSAMDSSDVLIDYDVMIKISDLYVKRVGNCKLNPISLHQALAGDYRNVLLTQTKTDTSTGWLLRELGINKHNFVKIDEENNQYTMNESFLREVNYIIDYLKDHDMILLDTQATLKDEAREKKLDNKLTLARKFVVSNKAMVVVSKLWLMPLITRLLSIPDKSGLFANINAGSQHWSLLAKYVTSLGSRVCDGDHSAFDSHHTRLLSYMVTFIYKLARSCGYSEFDSDMCSKLVKSMNITLMLSEGNYLLSCAGLNSGRIDTLFLNSIINLHLIYYWIHKETNRWDLFEMVRPAVVGDDMLIGILDGLNVSAESLSERFKTLGYEVTDAGKNSKPTWKTISDVQFLKRNFVNSDEIGVCAPIAVKVIWKSLAYECDGELTGYDRLKQVYYSMGREAFLHGRKFFEFYNTITLSCIPGVEELKYENLLSEYLEDRFNVWSTKKPVLIDKIIPPTEVFDHSNLWAQSEKRDVRLNKVIPSPKTKQRIKAYSAGKYSFTEINDTKQEETISQTVDIIASTIHDDTQSTKETNSENKIDERVDWEKMFLSWRYWADVNPSGTTSLNITPTFIYNNVPYFGQMVKSYKLMKFNAHIRISNPGNPYVSGAYLVFCVPFVNHANSTEDYQWYSRRLDILKDSTNRRFCLANKLGFPHMIIDIAKAEDHEIELPFLSEQRGYEIGEGWTLIFQPLTLLASENTAVPFPLSVYFKFSNVEFEVLSPQSKEYNTQTTSNISNYLRNLNLGSWTKEIAHKVLEGALTFAGFSRSTNELGSTMLTNNVNYSISDHHLPGQAQLGEHYNQMSFKGELTNFNDPDDIYSYMRDKDAVFFTNESLTRGTGFYFNVHPRAVIKTNAVNTGIAGPQGVIESYPLFYLSSMFELYTGSIDVNIVFYSTTLKRVRYTIYVIPPGVLFSSKSRDGKFLYTIVEVNGTTTVTVNVPYLYTSPFRDMGGLADLVASGSSSLYPVLAIIPEESASSVSTPLYCPFTISYTAGSDFELADPSLSIYDGRMGLTPLANYSMRKGELVQELKPQGIMTKKYFGTDTISLKSLSQRTCVENWFKCPEGNQQITLYYPAFGTGDLDDSYIYSTGVTSFGFLTYLSLIQSMFFGVSGSNILLVESLSNGNILLPYIYTRDFNTSPVIQFDSSTLNNVYVKDLGVGAPIYSGMQGSPIVLPDYGINLFRCGMTPGLDAVPTSTFEFEYLPRNQYCLKMGFGPSYTANLRVSRSAGEDIAFHKFIGSPFLFSYT